ncbi:MAG: hypothetical protein FJX36_12385 [Alphaproteobacteria bacterium]|nr:hypothetical protein [Alphaproteobacteria bacterium]
MERAAFALLALGAWPALAADVALPDPCYDPERPWPVYCERFVEDRVTRGAAAARFQLYAFYEDLAGDERPPAWVFDLEPPYRLSAIRLYDDQGTPLLCREFNVGDAWIEPPTIIEHAPERPLLVVSATHAGTGAIREDHVFRRNGVGWAPIAALPWGENGGDGWGQDLAARLPPGHAVWKGIAIDYATLSSTTPVWRDTDPNCCPTGGVATIRFAIRNDILVITDVAHDPHAAP